MDFVCDWRVGKIAEEWMGRNQDQLDHKLIESIKESEINFQLSSGKY